MLGITGISSPPVYLPGAAFILAGLVCDLVMLAPICPEIHTQSP
jgi:hypothetical protein